MTDFYESSDWFVVRGVPILDEHSLPVGNDGRAMKFDRNRLSEIAAHNQRRIDDTGDATPIVIGHTPRKAPDGKTTEQVPVVGFAKNFRIGTIGKLKPRAAILVDKWFPKDKAEEIRKYPRRSIELWPSDGTIDPISILGGETPMRDLGLMHYSRDSNRPDEKPLLFSHSSESPFRYSHGSIEADLDEAVIEDSLDTNTEPEAMSDQGPIDSNSDPNGGQPEMFDQKMLQDVMNNIMTSTPVFVWLNKQYEQAMEAQAAAAAQPAIDAMQVPPNAPIDDPTAVNALPPGPPNAPPGAPPGPPNGVPNAAPDNAPPMAHGEPDGDEPKSNGEPPMDNDEAYELANVKMSRDQLRGEVDTLRAENEKIKAERDEIQRKYTRARRETQLSDLQAEGYKFDRGAALQTMEGMNGKQAQSFIDNILKFSRRGPVGNVLRTPNIADGGDDPASRPMNEREFEEAKQYQRANPEKPWEACIQYAKGLLPV